MLLVAERLYLLIKAPEVISFTFFSFAIAFNSLNWIFNYIFHNHCVFYVAYFALRKVRNKNLNFQIFFFIILVLPANMEYLCPNSGNKNEALKRLTSGQ